MTDRIETGLAVVTGAGGGLGRALAIALCNKGMQVAGLGRQIDALKGTQDLIEGGQFHPIEVDVANAEKIAEVFDKLQTDIAPVRLLVNNAAVYPRRDILDETADSFMQTVNINLGGVVNCTQAALTQMTKTGVGRILNVSTFADIAPIPASAAYATSKGAARIFSRSCVADLGDRFPGIVITDWMPGMLATSMGIPDGLAPEVSAKWGAALALWDDPTLNGSTFEMDREMLPPRSFKRKIKDKLLLRKPPVARIISV